MFDKLTAYNFYCYDDHLINDRNIIKSGWKPDFCCLQKPLDSLGVRESFSGEIMKKIEAEVCVDHIHMLIEIPPKMSVSGFMGYLKGKSSQMIYEKWANLRYKYRSREFWCRGYYVDTVGKNTKKIQEYIQNQLKEDKIAEQLEL